NLFVSIKVDREERPDIDHIYMNALHALGEQGGWPLTMFLDADRRPFWGGTYFPPVSRYGRAGFPDVLKQVAAIYANDPGRIAHNGTALTQHLALTEVKASATPSSEELITQANRVIAAFDPVHGGLNGAPKFPNPPILNMLWRAAESGAGPELRTPVLTTLRQMARGGIQDHVGGGFARYSVDAEWLVPHFEKMLYDNAQLLELFALGWQRSGEPLLHDAAQGIVSWLSREMMVGEAFASSLDADSEGEEGKFYVWSRSDIESILGGEDARLFARLYDITNAGNFEGHNIPNRLRSIPEVPADASRMAQLRSKLLAARESRVRPDRDDKVLADWNGLMITALVRAGIILSEPDWVDMARRAHDWIRANMMHNGELAHSWLGGVGVHPGFALDHAAMALAAITLAEARNDSTLLTLAAADLDTLHRHYANAETGLLAMTHSGGESLIVRPAPLHDDAVPNANGIYAEALVRMAAMTGDSRYTDRLDRLLSHAGHAMRQTAMAHGSLWGALDLHLNGAHIVIVGDATDTLPQAALEISFPRRIVMAIPPGEALPAGHPAQAMLSVADGKSAAFVCRYGRCDAQLFSPQDLMAQFDRAQKSSRI
ncbi:MAG: thioredoxin domain-containing protein, partial [Beijerinckiaceae bacterium]